MDFEIKAKKDGLVKTIVINDKNDTIQIDLGDNDFIKNLYEIEEVAKKMRDEENFDFTKTTETLYSMLENLFGKGIIKKIFGRENPSLLIVYDFMRRLIEYVGEQMQKHFGNNLNRAGRRANARG